MVRNNGWLRVAWLGLVFAMPLTQSAPAAAEIKKIVVTSSRDIGPFRGKNYREVQATMEGVARGGAYTVPVVLAYPRAAGDYNGFAIVDVYNTVTVGDPDWVLGGQVFPFARIHMGDDYLFGNGNFYVGVLWDKDAAEFLHTGAIAAPSDGHEILRDAARLARDPAVGNFPPDVALPRGADEVIAYGFSQSAALLRGFYFRRLNMQNGNTTFDGALIVGPFGHCKYLDDPPGWAPCEGALSDGGKVIVINTETDVEYTGFAERGETPDYRVIEIAGVSHIPATQADLRKAGVPKQNPVDGFPVFRAALTNLQGWLRGTEPPPSIYITLKEGPAGALLGDPYKEAVRDSDGNALGGVRLPHLSTKLEDGKTAGAPLGAYRGLALDFKDTNFYFLLSGTFTPFPQDRLHALYPTHDAYVSAVSLAAEKLVSQRYILAEDADAYVKAAAEVDLWH